MYLCILQATDLKLLLQIFMVPAERIYYCLFNSGVAKLISSKASVSEKPYLSGSEQIILNVQDNYDAMKYVIKTQMEIFK